MRLRKNKLIDPGLQLRLTLWFVGVTALTWVFQFVALNRALEIWQERIPAHALPEVGPLEALLPTFVGALAVALFTTAVTGVLVTSRVCGPLYRFRQYLGSVARGEKPADCRIRKNDELQDLCELINAATKPLREQGGEGEEQDDSTARAA